MQLLQRIAVDLEMLALVQIFHPSGDCLGIAAGQLEQLALQVRRDQGCPWTATASARTRGRRCRTRPC